MESAKMKFGLIDACDLVGFPYAHGCAFQEVADSTNNDISFSSNQVLSFIMIRNEVQNG